jgi:hypothetical protein
MRTYIGTKIVDAEPQYYDGKPGYKVVYEDGYESWSPKDTFEAAYRPSDALPMGLAIEAIKRGMRVRRYAWPEKEFIFLVSGSNFKVSRAPLLQHFGEGTDIRYRPHIDKSNADGTIGVYASTNEDILADDWHTLE